MIRCIPGLIHQLRVNDPFVMFRNYQGKDWKNYIPFQPFDPLQPIDPMYHLPSSFTLYQTKKMELYIRHWLKDQEQPFYTNYSTLYMNILKGHIECVDKTIYDYKLITQHPINSKTVFQPFTHGIFYAKKNTVTLEMRHHSYMY